MTPDSLCFQQIIKRKLTFLSVKTSTSNSNVMFVCIVKQVGLKSLDTAKVSRRRYVSSGIIRPNFEEACPT